MKFRGRRQRGQALVELALCSIVLLLILLGATDFARLYQQHTALQEAAREGARHAAWYAGGTNPYLNNTTSIDRVISTALTGAGLTQPVVPKGTTQCPANTGTPPPDTSQIWVYSCIPSAASACPGAPAGSGQDVEIAVIIRFGLIVQSDLFFGPDFPMVGDAHFRVQGC